MDELTEAARTTGAVNTIHIKDGKFTGYNTDASGFLNSLLEAGFDPKGRRVAVLGAGGAARAVVFALARAEAASVTVLNRTAERAAFLVDDLADAFPDSPLHFAPLNHDSLAALTTEVDLVVNTTSAGMSPHTNESPWPLEVPLPIEASICDLVYNPLGTKFLNQGEAAGCGTIDGLGMLVHQGARSFKIWTGQVPPINAMRQACLQGLSLDELAHE
jgi:shikimate dehydrogenase